MLPRNIDSLNFGRRLNLRPWLAYWLDSNVLYDTLEPRSYIVLARQVLAVIRYGCWFFVVRHLSSMTEEHEY